jgi:UDP-glucuronate 4-epimerase
MISGAAGFIGSHLTDKLLKEGHRVVCFENFDSYYDPTLKWRNIERHLKNPKYRVVSGNVADFETLEKAFSFWNIDTVIHLAAQAGVRPSLQNPALHARVNVLGTVNVLEKCRQHEINRIVYTSSSSVYGNSSTIPFREDDSTSLPLCPYAATKKSSELACYTYHYLYGFNIGIVRPFTVYGERQRIDMAIPLFTRSIYDGKAITLHGGREVERDFTYVSDVVDGICGLMENLNGCETYNLGSGKPIVVQDLVKKIETLLGKKAKIKKAPLGNGEATKTYADISKAQKAFGYSPKISIDEGLERYVKWFLEERNVL